MLVRKGVPWLPVVYRRANHAGPKRGGVALCTDGLVCGHRRCFVPHSTRKSVVDGRLSAVAQEQHVGTWWGPCRGTLALSMKITVAILRFFPVIGACRGRRVSLAMN